MTSPTDKTNRCREAKKAARGKKAKNALRRNGTTPTLFALVKPTANEAKSKWEPFLIYFLYYSILGIKTLALFVIMLYSKQNS